MKFHVITMPCIDLRARPHTIPAGKTDTGVRDWPGRSYLPAGRSSFDAEHLSQLLDHFDQVLLVLHHLLDGLIRGGDLVQHALVLAALDAAGLLAQVVHAEPPLGLAAAHPAPRAVRRALERVRVSQPPHDVAAGAHRAGDDAQLAAAGPDGALARHQHLLAEMRLLRDVVV